MQTDINKLDDYIRVLNYVNAQVQQLGGNARPAGRRIEEEASINLGGSDPGVAIDA
jgi:hypothetical protein